MPGSGSPHHAITGCDKINAQELRHTMRIPQEFHAPRTRDEKIDHTIHDYVDGVLSRRSLVCRLTLLTGGAAAAMTLLEERRSGAGEPADLPLRHLSERPGHDQDR